MTKLLRITLEQQENKMSDYAININQIASIEPLSAMQTDVEHGSVVLFNLCGANPIAFPIECGDHLTETYDFICDAICSLSSSHELSASILIDINGKASVLV